MGVTDKGCIPFFSDVFDNTVDCGDVLLFEPDGSVFDRPKSFLGCWGWIGVDFHVGFILISICFML